MTTDRCTSRAPSSDLGYSRCDLQAGHGGPHSSLGETWPAVARQDQGTDDGEVDDCLCGHRVDDHDVQPDGGLGGCQVCQPCWQYEGRPAPADVLADLRGEHRDLSEPGNGRCSCGARPDPGEHIPTWWRRHALGEWRDEMAVDVRWVLLRDAMATWMREHLFWGLDPARAPEAADALMALPEFRAALRTGGER